LFRGSLSTEREDLLVARHASGAAVDRTLLVLGGPRLIVRQPGVASLACRRRRLSPNVQMRPLRNA
jgi:hypothetical protein